MPPLRLTPVRTHIALELRSVQDRGYTETRQRQRILPESRERRRAEHSEFSESQRHQGGTYLLVVQRLF